MTLPNTAKQGTARSLTPVMSSGDHCFRFTCQETWFLPDTCGDAVTVFRHPWR